MDEDINAANGITVVFELAKWINSGHYNQDVKGCLDQDVRSLWSGLCPEEVLDADIEALIAERQEARAKKDFARSRCHSVMNWLHKESSSWIQKKV